MANPKRGNEIPTIDVALVVITPAGTGAQAWRLDTANQMQVTPQTETVDAVKLVVKGILRAQKRSKTIVTGNTIVLTDNVFNPELVKILQGGEILYDNVNPTKVVGYHPPMVGTEDEGETFTLSAYSAIYNAAGLLTGYEQIDYPNCQGIPIAFSSQDGAFRAPEYTIYSAPDTGEAPYTITYVTALPTI